MGERKTWRNFARLVSQLSYIKIIVVKLIIFWIEKKLFISEKLLENQEFEQLF